MIANGPFSWCDCNRATAMLMVHSTSMTVCAPSSTTWLWVRWLDQQGTIDILCRRFQFNFDLEILLVFTFPRASINQKYLILTTSPMHMFCGSICRSLCCSCSRYVYNPCSPSFPTASLWAGVRRLAKSSSTTGTSLSRPLCYFPSLFSFLLSFKQPHCRSQAHPRMSSRLFPCVVERHWTMWEERVSLSASSRFLLPFPFTFLFLFCCWHTQRHVTTITSHSIWHVIFRSICIDVFQMSCFVSSC